MRRIIIALIASAGVLSSCSDFLGTDPDSDRVGIMVRDHTGKFVAVTGNQTGVLLLDYLIGALRRAGKMPEKPVFLKSIVTTNMARTVAEANGRPLTLTVARQPAEGMTQGTELELTLTPQWSTRKTIFGEDEKAWLIGIGPLGSVRVEELGFSEALKTGLVQTWRLVDLTWQSFVKLAQRVVPADQVGGPIMIAQMVGQQAEQGLVGVLGLAALISINLAILNLLPVPVLDGGQMLFCLIEMIFRRPVPQKIQEWGMRVGMALLLSLMIFATFNDVTRIINTPDEAPAVEKTAP